MRRALLFAALAVPGLARAQTISNGAIQFSKGANGDDLVHGPFVNAAECGSTTATVNLSWNTALASGASWPASAKYTVYASNKQHTAPNCTTTGNSSQGVNAGPVGSTITATAQTQPIVPYGTSEFVTVAGLSCTIGADTPIYVCVQAYQSDGTTIVGYALGTLTLSTSSPSAPTALGATPADDGALQVSWAAPSGHVTAYDYVLTVAGEGVDTTPRTYSDIVALSYMVTGLTNNVVYDISLVARSRAGNPSPAITTIGIPVNVQNFWDIYHDPPPNGSGGQEKGGCSTGGGGPAALLAVAALLAKLRRRA